MGIPFNTKVVDMLADSSGAGISATTVGAWVQTGEYREGGVMHLDGFGTATVIIYGANIAAQPATATNHTRIGASLTADTILDMGDLPEWIKVACESYTSGAPRARMSSSKR